MLGLVYLFTAKGHIEVVDTEYSIRTALSIVDNGKLLIDPPASLNEAAVNYFRGISNIPNQPETNGKIYSPYGIGLSIIFIPYVLLSKILGWLTGIELRLILDFILSFYNIPFAILGLYFFHKTTTLLGASNLKSSLLTVFLGVGTCYWKYTVTDFSEISQGSILLVILYIIIKKDKNMWYKLSFLYSFLVLLKLTYFIFLPLLLIYFIKENFRLNPTFIINNFLKSSSFLVPTCIFIAVTNTIRFYSPFKTGYGNNITFNIDFFFRDWFDYLISLDRGILSFSPILFISLIGIFFITKRYINSFLIIGIIVLIWYLTMCFWVSLQGGFCWGNRLLVPIIPLIVLPLVFLDFRKASCKLLLFPTLIGSIIIQLAGSFTKVHEIILIKLEIQELSNQIHQSQLWIAIKLFLNKIKSPNAEYLASSFGIDNSDLINLSNYNTFHGFNLWVVHLLNHFGLMNYSHTAGILILFITIISCFTLLRINKIYTQK